MLVRDKPNTAQFHLLPGGGEHRCNGYGFVFTCALRNAAALIVSSAQQHLFQTKTLHPALTADFHRGNQISEFDPFGFRLRDLVLVGRHLFLAAAVIDRHLRAETDSGTRHIQRHIAAADDCDLITDLRALALVDMAQKVHAGIDAVKLLPGDIQLRALGGTDSQIEGLIAFLPQRVERHVPADLHAGLKFYAQLTQHIDFGVEDALFQPEGGNAQREHTAQHLLFFKNGDRVALDRQIVSAAQARRACADHGDLLRVGLADLIEELWNITGIRVQLPLGDVFLDLVDGHRRVHIAAGAGLLALLVADAPADRRERDLLLDELQRLGIAPLGGQFDVALHRYMGGTGRLAGCRSLGHDIRAGRTVIRRVTLRGPERIAGRLCRARLIGRTGT